MITLNNVYKFYNKGTLQERCVMNGLSLKIEEGEFVTIIGTNGAGKSTLFKLISGESFPSAGTISVRDNNITHMPTYKRAKYIGKVFQDPLAGTAHSLTIRENLALAVKRGQARRLFVSGSQKYNTERFQATLATLNLGLEDRLDMPIGLLSGGQRQCITLLMATLIDPDVLLLDEHTAALDPKTAETVMHITNGIYEERKVTTLCITHNLSHAIAYGNRLIMLRDGQVAIDVKGEAKQKLTRKDLIDYFI